MTVQVPWQAPACEHMAKQDQEAVEKVCRYLRRFQYLQTDSAADAGPPNEKELKAALTSYQTVAGLTPTGDYDSETAQRMNDRRCGLPDHPPRDGRLAEFLAGPTKWTHLQLTYRIEVFSTDPSLPPADAQAVISAAFDKWAAVTRLSFRPARRNEHADIRIGWYSRRHPVSNDGAPFDGVGRVLAHAFYPPPNGGDLAGDVHFDEDETWDRALLENVALHEIGHSLGLDHSNVKTAVMYMYANGVTKLTEDDVAGIQSIYGPP